MVLISKTALDEDQRRQIYAMFANKASTKAIAAKTGVDEKAIKAMRTKWKEKRKEERASQVNARDNMGARARACTRAMDLSTTQAQRDAALSGLADLIPVLVNGLGDVDSIEGEHDKAWARATYSKVLFQIYSKLGSWGGLDNPEPEPILTSPVDTWVDRAKEVSDE